MALTIKKLGPGEWVCYSTPPKSQVDRLRAADLPEIKGVCLRKSNMTKEQASKIIEDLKKGKS